MKDMDKTKEQLIQELEDYRRRIGELEKQKTERKRAEVALRFSEEKLAKAFLASPDAIAISTLLEGRFFDVNGTFLKMSGYRSEEVIGQPSTELGLWVNPGDRANGLELLQQKGSIANFEAQFRMKSGVVLDMLWSAEVIEHGGIKYIVSVFRDTTEHNRKNEELRRNYDLQNVINALLRLSLEETSLEIILEKAIDLILPVPWLVLELKGAILLVEEDPEVLVMKAQRGLAKILRKVCSRVPFGKCICGRAAIKGEIEFADRIDERHDIYYEGMIPHGHYCVPILSSGKVLGVLNLYLKEGHIRQQKEEDFLWAISNTLAGIIMRKQTEKALRSSEEQFRSLFNQAADCILLMDPSDQEDPIIVDANLAAHAMHGYAPGELIGKPISLLDEPETRKHIPERIKILLSGRHLTGEARHVRKDGSTFSIDISAQLIQLKGKSYIQAIDRDITERKRAEEALQESQQHQKAILDNIPDMAWLKDKECRFIAVNEPFGKSCGFSPEDLVGKTDLDIWPRDFAERYRADDQEVMESGKRKQVEEPLTDSEGKAFWIETIKTPILDEQENVIGTAGIARNITERKQAEEDKKNSFEQLRKALGATVQAIASVVESRDPYTAGHQRRVADLSRSIASEMRLSKNKIDGIRMASLIHDIGKISVPAEILIKPTKLTEIELNLIKTHAQNGYDILKDIEFPWPIARIVHEHHERMNGSGYPNALTGDEILLESRILAVADVVEAIASYRPYRPALGIEKALEEILRNKGVLYDPEVVEICLRLFREKGYSFN